MSSWLGSLMLGLTLAAIADTPPAPASAPVVKLKTVPRSGYALVTAESADGKPIKQVEWIVTSSGPTGDISYDFTGNTLIVTLPPAGTVTVHAVGLLADGSLAPSVSTDLAVKPAPVPAAAKKLIVTLVVNQATMSPAEQALINSQALTQGLRDLGYSYAWADVNDPKFKPFLDQARATNPRVPGPGDTPFLFIQDATTFGFVNAYRVTLGSEAKANADVILALFRTAPMPKP